MPDIPIAAAPAYKVLHIESNEADRDKVRSLLGTRFELYEATTARQGMDLLHAEQPDCILLDFSLPGVDALDVLQEFVNKNAAVVVLTGQGDNVIGIDAMRKGAQDYLIKQTLNSDMLSRVVLYACERNQLMRQHHESLAALRESEQRFAELATRIDHALWIWSADNLQCLYHNPAFERIFGRDMEAMNAINWTDVIHPDDRHEEYRKSVESKLKKTEYESRYRIVRPDGEIRHIENRCYPVLNDKGELVRVAGICQDVTHRIRLEEELRMAQKLEAIGQLAAGVAHEINTPSQYVSDNVSFMSDAFDHLVPILRAYGQLMALAQKSGVGEKELQEYRKLVEDADLDYLLEELPVALRQSRQGLDQITKIVRAMKDFSHPGDDKQPTNLNRAIESTVTVARNEWKYVAEMKLDLDEALPVVTCVPSAINQVLLNLIVNAAHAIGDVVGDKATEKGKITIATRTDDDEVVIRVTDTGCGIPESIRKKIFDPFFTTKEVGKGTGQGLAIAYTVVTERHGGTISVDSEPGKGSSFVIRLPVDGQGAGAEDQAA